MHPTQAIEIFGNVSTPFGTLAICDITVNILRRSSQRTPALRELNTRGIAEYSDFVPIERYISETVQDRPKLVLIINRTSHMSFRLVPNSVTLDDLERHNSANRRIISPNSVAFWANYVKVVGDTPILSATEM